MRPRSQGESLNHYAELAVEELRKKAALKAHNVDAVWEEIFNAICHEGWYVREVSPAAVVIYQRYLGIAALYLKECPDERKREQLGKRVKEDLAHNLSKYSKMSLQNFSLEERREGSRAFGIIKRTLLSIA